MMTLRQFYLIKLAEECDEVSHRALKQTQFGAEQVQKGDEVKDGVAPPNKEAGLTNRQRLTNELKDLATTVKLLVDLGEIEDTFETATEAEFEAWETEKKTKIQKYLKYSQE